MENVRLTLYEKNEESGILENLLGSYLIEENIELIDKAYVSKIDKQLKVNLHLTTLGEFGDQEYEAIYDNYNGESFKDKEVTIEEVEDSYNPTWLFTFDFLESSGDMENEIMDILSIHKEELKKIIEEIQTIEE